MVTVGVVLKLSDELPERLEPLNPDVVMLPVPEAADVGALASKTTLGVVLKVSVELPEMLVPLISGVAMVAVSEASVEGLPVNVTPSTVMLEPVDTVPAAGAAATVIVRLALAPLFMLQSFLMEGGPGTGYGLRGAMGLSGAPPTASTVSVARFGSAVTGSVPMLRFVICIW
jgi:hypothetical protein